MKDNQALTGFWDKAFTLSEEQQAEVREQAEGDWKELAPSEKLFRAASSLGQKKKVLDYGCGDGWASVIAAKSGCTNVTAVDAAPGAVRAARFFTEAYGVGEHVHSNSVESHGTVEDQRKRTTFQKVCCCHAHSWNRVCGSWRGLLIWG